MTTVTLADGTQYPIPTGAPGSYPWVREASLISVAYQQAQDYGNALKWRKEYERRAAAWNAVEAGADMEAIISAGSWLDGPAMIVSYLAKTTQELIDAAAKVPHVALGVVSWVPWLVLGGLVVLGLGLHKGNIRARIGL